MKVKSPISRQATGIKSGGGREFPTKEPKKKKVKVVQELSQKLKYKLLAGAEKVEQKL